MNHSKLFFLFIALVLFLVPSAFATVHYDPSNGYCFTLPAYQTALRFASAQTFTNVSRIGNFWYFNGTFEFSVQNGNLTVDQLWTGKVFIGHVAGTDGNLAAVSIFDVGFGLPVSVSSSSGTVTQASDYAGFLSSGSSVWFYDSGSGRIYLRVLISGYTSFVVNYNVLPPPPPPLFTVSAANVDLGIIPGRALPVFVVIIVSNPGVFAFLLVLLLLGVVYWALRKR